MNIQRLAAACLVAFGLGACASAQFPETGTPSPYDGHWTAALPAQEAECADITAKFEIRYGMAIGTVSEKGQRIAEIWGQINPNGHMEGLVGQLGITGATTSIDFKPDTAAGTWKSEYCTGTLEAQKVG